MHNMMLCPTAFRITARRNNSHSSGAGACPHADAGLHRSCPSPIPHPHPLAHTLKPINIGNGGNIQSTLRSGRDDCLDMLAGLTGPRAVQEGNSSTALSREHFHCVGFRGSMNNYSLSTKPDHYAAGCTPRQLCFTPTVHEVPRKMRHLSKSQCFQNNKNRITFLGPWLSFRQPWQASFAASDTARPRPSPTLSTHQPPCGRGVPTACGIYCACPPSAGHPRSTVRV
jgi:hypothetical protein